MTECSICIEPFNKSTKKPIKCPDCQFEICLTCTKTFFKNSEKSSPCCAGCNKIFTDDFMREKFPKIYINNELKRILENVLFEEEKQLLPATQELAKYEMHIRTVEAEVATDDLRIETLQAELITLRRTVAIKRNKIQHWRVNMQMTNVNNNKEQQETVNNTWIKHCPDNDCNGYLSTQWKCDMCNIKVCKECHERKDENHQCNPDNVATAIELMKSAKSCPGCGISIIKQNGCNQMWCTHCKTAFDWTTRKIVNTNIHNPHYYEWLRDNNGNGTIQREIGDVICGGLPNAHMLYDFISKIPCTQDMNEAKENLYIFNRLLLHVNGVELRTPVADIVNNADLRIKYLNKEITLEKLKQMCLTRQSKNKNKKNKQLIFQTLRDAGTDIMQNFISKHMPLKEAHKQLQNLIDYINRSFEIMSKKYSCSTFIIVRRAVKRYTYNGSKGHEGHEFVIETIKY